MTCDLETAKEIMPRKKVVRSGADLRRVRVNKFRVSLREVATAAHVAPRPCFDGKTKERYKRSRALAEKRMRVEIKI